MRHSVLHAGCSVWLGWGGDGMQPVIVCKHFHCVLVNAVFCRKRAQASQAIPAATMAFPVLSVELMGTRQGRSHEEKANREIRSGCVTQPQCPGPIKVQRTQQQLWRAVQIAGALSSQVGCKCYAAQRMAANLHSTSGERPSRVPDMEGMTSKELVGESQLAPRNP